VDANRGVMKKEKFTVNNVTCPFLTKYSDDVIGVLSGFDRLRLRGCLCSLYHHTVCLRYLWVCQVLLKGFKHYAISLTGRIIGPAQSLAQRAGRPWEYLNSGQISKEDRVREILCQSPVQHGLVAILRCVEPGQTYEVRHLKPARVRGQCVHLYFYHRHRLFGLIPLRLQTWFPSPIEINLNGREWLARQMDRAHLSYQRQDNYFAWLEDPLQAQRLMDNQGYTRWPAHFQQRLNRYHPLHREICRPLNLSYYWSCAQSEFATDIMFRDPDRLAALLAVTKAVASVRSIPGRHGRAHCWRSSTGVSSSFRACAIATCVSVSTQPMAMLRSNDAVRPGSVACWRCCAPTASFAKSPTPIVTNSPLKAAPPSLPYSLPDKLTPNN
jgi:hypothetical protein